MIDKLTKMLAEQERLQRESFGNDPKHLSGEALIDFIRWNTLALEDELHEALAETGWKPWATSKHVNRQAFIGELVDAFHFFMNLMLAVDCTADELFATYLEKHKLNAKRQAEGYDGVSEKCEGCGRALDDAAVECTEGYCSVYQSSPEDD